MKKKVIGIIGGMGPMATVDLFQKLIDYTEAKTDAEHIHIIIDNYPQISDRTQAIMAGDNSVVCCLVEAAKRLECAGAELLLIACNTSHYFYNEICKEINVPVIHMIRECAKKVQSKGYKKVALLATDGVVYSGLYTSIFAEHGIEVLLPDSNGQKKVMDLIYEEIKAGKEAHPEKLFKEMIQLEKEGAQAFILGCTELPIVFKEIVGNFVDPTSVLAEAAILAAGYQCKRKGK